MQYTSLHTSYFLYVPNNGSSKISEYSVNSSTGALTELAGSPISTLCSSPTYAIVDSTNSYLFVGGASCVVSYAIDQSTGALSQISTASTAYSGGMGFATIAGNRILYAGTTNGNTMSSFSTQNGSLSSLGTTTAVNGSGDMNYMNVAVAPNNKYFFAGSATGSNVVIQVFTLDQTTGAPTASGTTTGTAGYNINWMSLHPGGSFLYFSNSTSSDIVLNLVAPSNGAFGSFFYYSSGLTTPFYMTMDPAGKFLYTGDLNSNKVAAFSINQSNGTLTAISGSPFSMADSRVWGVTVDPTGSHLYVSNYNGGTGHVSAYNINSVTGALTLVNSVSADSNPMTGAFATTSFIK